MVSEPAHSDEILVVCQNPSSAKGFVQLFEASGFIVHCHDGELHDLDLSRYGAIVHLAQSEKMLHGLLGDELAAVNDEEWILIEGGADDHDYHCTVQLTRQASLKLRVFVRSLWAQFAIT